MDLHPHIEKFARRLAEVEAALNDPKVFDSPKRAQELSREYSRLKELVALGTAYAKRLALSFAGLVCLKFPLVSALAPVIVCALL